MSHLRAGLGFFSILDEKKTSLLNSGITENNTRHSSAFLSPSIPPGHRRESFKYYRVHVKSKIHYYNANIYSELK